MRESKKNQKKRYCHSVTFSKKAARKKLYYFKTREKGGKTV